MLSKYVSTRLYGVGALQYIVRHMNNKYLVHLKYESGNVIKSITVDVFNKDDTTFPVGDGDFLFESLKKDLTKVGIEFKINGNIINIRK